MTIEVDVWVRFAAAVLLAPPAVIEATKVKKCRALQARGDLFDVA